jgi:hypothetical protein
LSQRSCVYLKEYRSKESDRQAYAQYRAIIDFNPQLKLQMADVSVDVASGVSISKLHMYASDTTLQLKRGMRSARASDALTLKALAGPLTNQTVAQNSRTDRGFNNNGLGRMLIPIEDLEAYDRDPVGGVPDRISGFQLLIAMCSVRALVNAGDPSYEVTAQLLPTFLYKDPSKYDPNNILAGLLRGPFLVRVSNFNSNVMYLNGLVSASGHCSSARQALFHSPQQSRRPLDRAW